MKVFAGLLFAVAVLAASPAVAQGKTVYLACHVTTYHASGGVNGGGRSTTYLSKVFPGPSGQHNPIAESFRRYVEGNYSDVGQVKESMCTFTDSEQITSNIRANRVKSTSHQLIEVDWSNG